MGTAWEVHGGYIARECRSGPQVRRRYDVEIWRTDCASRHLKMRHDAPGHRRGTNHAARFSADGRRTFTLIWDRCPRFTSAALQCRSPMPPGYLIHEKWASAHLFLRFASSDPQSLHLVRDYTNSPQTLRTEAMSACNQFPAAPSPPRMSPIEPIGLESIGRNNVRVLHDHARVLHDTESRVNDTPIS